MKRLLIAISFLGACCYLPACKSKVSDAEIKSQVEAVLASEPAYSGLTADVSDGVVTVNGSVQDATDKAGIESRIAGVKGVKSVQDNSTVTPPPPPTEPVIAADDPLTKGVTDALKDFPGINATVNDGIITVTGEASAADWRKVKMALDALRPKRVDASGLKVK